MPGLQVAWVVRRVRARSLVVRGNVVFALDGVLIHRDASATGTADASAHAGRVARADNSGLALMIGGHHAPQLDHPVSDGGVDEIARRQRLFRQLGEDARTDRLIVLGKRRRLAPDARERAQQIGPAGDDAHDRRFPPCYVQPDARELTQVKLRRVVDRAPEAGLT